jgi:hypothetical protein
VNVKYFYRLDVFDYLYAGDVADYPNQCILDFPSVAFAGNLSKSNFIGKLIDSNTNVRLKLYGPREDNRLYNKNVEYVGNFTPDEIPGKMQADYGLVWDGDGIVGCTGSLGEYTKINNPHKLSLYLAAGMPVIVWEQAAVADFVRKNNVGLAVDRIDNLAERLCRVSIQQYESMKNCVQMIRNDIVSGNNLKRVLQQIQELERI